MQGFVRSVHRGPARSLAARAARPLSSLADDNARLKRELQAAQAQVAALQQGGSAAGSAAASEGPLGPWHASLPRAPAEEVSKFVGAAGRYTHKLDFHHHDRSNYDNGEPMPCFRLMDDIGRLVPGADAASLPDLNREVALAIIAQMVRVSEFDKIFNDAQRQGRISFYMTSRGEEACSVASAAALAPTDWMLPQYRELGAFFWRGLTFDDVANQLCGNALDKAHGRQLPLHTGGLKQHILYVKSTLGTQCPHAAGAAYQMKMEGRDQCAIAYFGEGCASEGDVPSALNIAAVHGCPTIFFCRNNGYAISTGTADQYKSDGIGPRGLAFGMPTIRVDGNDVLAVLAATKRAREIALEEGTPVMVEAMTYRIGAHSTSDDDTKYRTPDAPEEGWDSERAYWEARSPIIRFGRYLLSKGWFNVQLEEQIRKAARRDAIATLNRAQGLEKPAIATLFSDVNDELPWNLREQEDELRTHLRSYREHYPTVTQKQLDEF